MIKQIISRYKTTLSNESLEAFESILIRKEFKKNEIILEQGQVSRYMYIAKKGIIRQFYYKDGRDITEHFSSEGQIVACIESLFLKEPTQLAIEVIESSVIYLINYDKFKNLANLYSDINTLFQNILEYKLVVSQQKADSWRFESSRQRYERFLKEYPEIAKRASVAHIASYLIMTPETLSRVRAVSCL